MRHIDDAERRARIGVRHGIAPSRRRATPEAAADSMTVLHATDPSTIYLSVAARAEGIGQADVAEAFVERRTLIRQMAMRRTLFGVPRHLLPAVLGSASARIAESEGRRLSRDLEAAGIADDGSAWLARQSSSILEVLSASEPMTTAALRGAVPEAGGSVSVASGTRWGGDVPIAPRLLTYLAARGLVARGPNDGHWRTSRPTWTTMVRWLGEVPAPMPPDEGYAEIVRHWLWTFGPGTERDIAWWLGAPLGVVRRALTTVGAVAVSLDGGGRGFVLPDDLEPVAPVEPWAAVLPVLDPTVMGWKERAFYLGAHAPNIVDSVGNAGTTAWWNGRIVGAWVQDPDGDVRVVFVDAVPREARRALDTEAARLREWLGDVRIVTTYSAAATRAARDRRRER